MYVAIRKFNQMRSVGEAARRAETGIGGYYVFDAGHGVGGSVTLFEDRDTASRSQREGDGLDPRKPSRPRPR
jgi:hypothetical protein